MRLINTIFIGFLPIRNNLTPRLICFRMGIKILFLIPSCAYTLTFIATNLLVRHWNKNLIADKTLAILAYFMGILVLFKDIYRMVARHTQGSEIIHAIILTHTNRDFMMNIKISSVLFRRLAAFLANPIPFTNGLRNFQPSITIIDIPTTIVPMVRSCYPFIHMLSIGKKQVSFLFPVDAVWRKFKLFAAATSTFYFCAWFTLRYTDFCLRFFRMCTPIEGVILTKLDSFFAFFRAACLHYFGIIAANSKRLTAYHTGFFNADRRCTFLLFHELIITQLGVVYNNLGYDPDEELVLSQTENTQKLEQQQMMATMQQPVPSQQQSGQQPAQQQQESPFMVRGQ